MLRRPIFAALCSVAIGTLGLLCAQCAEAKDPEIKDGISGTVVKVDVSQGTVTVTDKNSRERTYSITQETVIVGPRGGVVRRRLKDPRFHNGLPITVVADGSTAAELHLGYDRKSREATAASRSASGTSSARKPANDSSSTNDAGPATPPPTSAPETPAPATSTTRTSRFRGLGESKRAAAKEAKSDEDEDEDSEFPGKVKSVDPAKRMLVITLVNGKDRSFLLAADVKVMVNNRVSRHGLSDASLQPGIPLTVITEAGGRKVKEVKVTTTATRRLRKAS